MNRQNWRNYEQALLDALVDRIGNYDMSGIEDVYKRQAVMWLGSSTVAGFPVSFIVVLVIYVIMHILLTKTALGRSIYCVGGNPEAARLSGINSANVLTFCYTCLLYTSSRANVFKILFFVWVLRHSLKSIKPNKLHILLLLRSVYRFINIKPVSYTHLDVYKRQEQLRLHRNQLLRQPAYPDAESESP